MDIGKLFRTGKYIAALIALLSPSSFNVAQELSVGEWQVRLEKDPFTDEAENSAYLQSNEQLSEKLSNGFRSGMVIRCAADKLTGTEVFLVLGWFPWGDDQTVDYRFDDTEAVMNIPGHVSSTGMSFYLVETEVAGFLDLMGDAKRLIVNKDGYAAEIIYSFDVEGFSEVEELLKCPKE